MPYYIAHPQVHHILAHSVSVPILRHTSTEPELGTLLFRVVRTLNAKAYALNDPMASDNFPGNQRYGRNVGDGEWCIYRANDGIAAPH